MVSNCHCCEIRKMKKFSVELIEDEDLKDGEIPEDLSCKIKFAHAGIEFSFETPNIHFYTAEQIRKFASEPSGELTFEDCNGYTGICKEGGKVTFTCSRTCSNIAVTLDAADCEDLFLELACQLASTDVKPVELYRDFEATSVEFETEDSHCLMAVHGRGGMKTTLRLLGLDASHIPALTDILNGKTVEIESSLVEHVGFHRIPFSGAHLRSDGNWLLLGPRAKTPFDILPLRFEKQKCDKFLAGLINYLNK